MFLLSVCLSVCLFFLFVLLWLPLCVIMLCFASCFRGLSGFACFLLLLLSSLCLLTFPRALACVRACSELLSLFEYSFFSSTSHHSFFRTLDLDPPLNLNGSVFPFASLSPSLRPPGQLQSRRPARLPAQRHVNLPFVLGTKTDKLTEPNHPYIPTCITVLHIVYVCTW